MPLICRSVHKERLTGVRDFAIVIIHVRIRQRRLARRFITHNFDILKSSQDYAPP